MAKQQERGRRLTKKTLDQAEQVMNLRKIGVSYRAIGKQLGIHFQRAHQLHEIALRESLTETTEDYIRVQEERVEMLMQRALISEQKTEDARDKASLINAALKATDQLNRIRGIYDRTETESQANAATLLQTLVDNSRIAAQKQTTPTGDKNGDTNT